jgi:hypothetical protein
MSPYFFERLFHITKDAPDIVSNDSSPNPIFFLKAIDPIATNINGISVDGFNPVAIKINGVEIINNKNLFLLLSFCNMLNDAKLKSSAGKEYSICANEISKIANGLKINT